MHKEVLGSPNRLRYPAKRQKVKAAGLSRRAVEENVLGGMGQYYSIDLNTASLKAIIVRENR